MSKQTTKDILHKVNNLLGIEDSYKAPDRVMQIIQDNTKKKECFLMFIKAFEYDLSYEWFNDYFQDEHADRKNKKQDFTPESVSNLMALINGGNPQCGVIYEPAAGTGSTIIAHWMNECKKLGAPWNYNPLNCVYLCEEISDKTVPFLLFNLLIRGMNAVVIHGDTLTRETKEVYWCANKKNELMCFSDLHILPHSKEIEGYFNIKFKDKENMTRVE